MLTSPTKELPPQSEPCLSTITKMGCGQVCAEMVAHIKLVDMVLEYTNIGTGKRE